MSDRPDLDEFASKMQAGGWEITGGKYAPKPPMTKNTTETNQASENECNKLEESSNV